MFDPKALAQAEWEQFKQSKVVKLIIAAEISAVIAFIGAVISGTQHLDFHSLKFWVASQFLMAGGLFVRHTLAGIEAKIGLAPELVAMIEERAKLEAIKLVAEKHPEAAALLKVEFEKKA